MKTFLLGSTIFFLSLFPSIAFADFQVATIDVNRVLNESTEAREKRKVLDDKAAVTRKKLEERGKTLRDTEQKLKKENKSLESKEVQQLRNDARDFERTVKDAEEDLKKEFLKINKTLAEKAVKLITAYAKNHNIDLVLDKGDRGRGPVLFGNESFDITDKIVVEMNKS